MSGKFGTVYPTANISLHTSKIVSNPHFRYRSIGRGEWSLLAYRSNVNVDILSEKYGRRIWGIFHTFHLLLPEEKYSKEHPEYFAYESFLRFFKRRGMRQL